jgi:ankyrin repeat protein
MVASYHGRLPVVEVLLARGAAVGARDEDGDTALHHASSGGHTDVISALLDKGAASTSRTPGAPRR